MEIAPALRKKGEWGEELYTGLLAGSNMNRSVNITGVRRRGYFESVTFIRVSRARYLEAFAPARLLRTQN